MSETMYLAGLTVPQSDGHLLIAAGYVVGDDESGYSLTDEGRDWIAGMIAVAFAVRSLNK